MPIFCYRCPDCGHEQEAIRRIKDAKKTLFCEECGSQMENVIAKPAKMVRGKGNWSTPA